jgi:sRNA-binding regulator protein Hfq
MSAVGVTARKGDGGLAKLCWNLILSSWVSIRRRALGSIWRDFISMSNQTVPPRTGNASRTRSESHAQKVSPALFPFRLTARAVEQEPLFRQAELFYLQKQIQSQTPMVIVLEDDERVEGCIEWYDRKSLKVRGRTRVLVYKSAIKYMYKQGDIGQ